MLKYIYVIYKNVKMCGCRTKELQAAAPPGKGRREKSKRQTQRNPSKDVHLSALMHACIAYQV